MHGTCDTHEETPQECICVVCCIYLTCLCPHFLSRAGVLDPLNSTREDNVCEMLERKCTRKLGTVERTPSLILVSYTAPQQHIAQSCTDRFHAILHSSRRWPGFPAAWPILFVNIRRKVFLSSVSKETRSERGTCDQWSNEGNAIARKGPPSVTEVRGANLDASRPAFDTRIRRDDTVQGMVLTHMLPCGRPPPP